MSNTAYVAEENTKTSLHPSRRAIKQAALALALALSLPSGMVYADQIRIATFGVVVFSVLLQGMTMPMLLRRVTRA